MEISINRCNLEYNNHNNRHITHVIDEYSQSNIAVDTMQSPSKKVLYDKCHDSDNFDDNSGDDFAPEGQINNYAYLSKILTIINDDSTKAFTTKYGLSFSQVTCLVLCHNLSLHLLNNDKVRAKYKKKKKEYFKSNTNKHLKLQNFFSNAIEKNNVNTDECSQELSHIYSNTKLLKKLISCKPDAQNIKKVFLNTTNPFNHNNMITPDLKTLPKNHLHTSNKPHTKYSSTKKHKLFDNDMHDLQQETMQYSIKKTKLVYNITNTVENSHQIHQENSISTTIIKDSQDLNNKIFNEILTPDIITTYQEICNGYLNPRPLINNNSFDIPSYQDLLVIMKLLATNCERIHKNANINGSTSTTSWLSKNTFSMNFCFDEDNEYIMKLCNDISKNLLRRDYINHLGTYQKLQSKISQYSEQLIYRTVDKILRGESLSDIQDTNIINLSTKVVFLLFAIEPSRQPISLLAHLMTLDDYIHSIDNNTNIKNFSPMTQPKIMPISRAANRELDIFSSSQCLYDSGQVVNDKTSLQHISIFYNNLANQILSWLTKKIDNFQELDLNSVDNLMIVLSNLLDLIRDRMSLSIDNFFAIYPNHQVSVAEDIIFAGSQNLRDNYINDKDDDILGFLGAM